MPTQVTDNVLRVDNLLIAPSRAPIELNVRHGEIVGLMGRNASGKTALLQALAGRRKFTSGHIFIENQQADAPLLLHKLTGFVPDHPEFWPRWTVERFLTYFARKHGVLRPSVPHRVDASLAATDLLSLRNRALGELSRGQQQRVALAQAMVHDPPLFLLDEPANALDAPARQTLHAFLREQARLGKAILIAGQLLEDLKDVVDRIGILADGQIVAQGPVQEILRLAGTHRLVEIHVLKFREQAVEVIAGAPGHWQRVEGAPASGLGIDTGPLIYEVDASDAQLAQALLLLLKRGIRSFNICCASEN